MQKDICFVPICPVIPEGLLARYRPHALSGSARELVSQLTAPGDLVLDLFCHGPALMREIVRLGRRAVGISINPMNLLIAALQLEILDAPRLNVAFTRLADSPKGDVPLHRYLNGLYRSHCPTCGAAGVAEWFAWDREARYPYAKAVRCPRCDGSQEGPTDEEDIAAARRFEPKGLAYHYALNRVVPADHAARERTAELVGLYTPRNLSSLIDIAMRLEGLDLEREARRALEGLLVGALDLGSNLDPHQENRARPRTLRVPVRFMERNVWHLMEQGLTDLISFAERESAALPRAPSLETLVEDRAAAYVLTPSSARDVGDLLGSHRPRLVLADPPRPDGVFWALCALWAGLLWNTAAARGMRAFLGRRRFDWEWHQRAMRVALRALGPQLDADGYLATLFAEPDERMVESVCLAASGAGYDLLGWEVDPGSSYQLVWRWSGRGPQPMEEMDLARCAAEQALSCLRARGEPTPWTVLHASVYAGLADDGTLGRVSVPQDATPLAFVAQNRERGLDQLAMEELGEEGRGYWIPALGEEKIEPLADRVEERVWEAFQSRAFWTEEELLKHVYGHFQGPQTPERSLVLACLRSYYRREEDRWQRREEDDPDRRAEELRSLRRDLSRMGERLGFGVGQCRAWDMRWREEGEDRYVFVLSPTAMVGRYLLFGPPVPGEACPCLVFPGGRAELLAHKLQRDPRLSLAAEKGGWEFIKFRHLRRLTVERPDRRTFEAVLRLDPVTDGEGVQIPLMLGGET